MKQLLAVLILSVWIGQPGFAQDPLGECCALSGGVGSCTSEGALMCKNGKAASNCTCEIQQIATRTQDVPDSGSSYGAPNTAAGQSSSDKSAPEPQKTTANAPSCMDLRLYGGVTAQICEDLRRSDTNIDCSCF